jgi:Ssp1 endopeptidase immunity protein Rap1a
MRKCLVYIATVGIAAVAVCGAQAAPATQDDFQVQTTANLVALCSADQTDPLYTAAQNFCEGFVVGTYRLIAIQEAASTSRRRLFCPAASGPTRNQAMADFVQWARGRPKTLASSPTDGIVEYLVTKYPCT